MNAKFGLYDSHISSMLGPVRVYHRLITLRDDDPAFPLFLNSYIIYTKLVNEVFCDVFGLLLSGLKKLMT